MLGCPTPGSASFCVFVASGSAAASLRGRWPGSSRWLACSVAEHSACYRGPMVGSSSCLSGHGDMHNEMPEPNASLIFLSVPGRKRVSGKSHHPSQHTAHFASSGRPVTTNCRASAGVQPAPIRDLSQRPRQRRPSLLRQRTQPWASERSAASEPRDDRKHCPTLAAHTTRPSPDPPLPQFLALHLAWTIRLRSGLFPLSASRSSGGGKSRRQAGDLGLCSWGGVQNRDENDPEIHFSTGWLHCFSNFEDWERS